MAGYVQDELPPEEVERQRALYGPLTQSVRELVDATIRTTVDDDEIRAVQAEVEDLVARLRKSELDGPYGVRFSRGRGRPWGNPVVGLAQRGRTARRDRARPERERRRLGRLPPRRGLRGSARAWCTAGSRR